MFKNKNQLKYLLTIKIVILIFNILLSSLSLATETRIKDIVSIEGIRENILIGYGIVVGLNGTGDNLSNSAFTQKGLVDFLERLGVNTRGANLKTKNLAAVTVTASLPSFSRIGNKIDIAVSTLGDAKSLQGGTLLATPMLGADGEVYAVAQGQVSLGGFSAATKSGNSVNKGVATNGFIPSGAIIEKEIDFDLRNMKSLKLSLRNADLSTAIDIANVINQQQNYKLAVAIDPKTIELNIPSQQQENVVELLAQIEQLTVKPDQTARIIIDEASGTIVMGQNVRISPVAVAQGNLTVTISQQNDISQPNSLSNGLTTVNTTTTIKAEEDKGSKIQTLKSNSTLQELVDGLNALGVGPRDLINILQNIKAAHALQAEIETR